jgi:hypothetical protein
LTFMSMEWKRCDRRGKDIVLSMIDSKPDPPIIIWISTQQAFQI